MVKVKITLLAFLISAGSFAQEDQTSTYDANSLKERLRNGAQDKASAAERIKSARGDKSSLKILQDTDLNYKLPNGEYVTGILLPNGTLSPAINTKFGTKPACVTKNYELILGVWDEKKESIVCNIPHSELAYIDEVKFESSMAERQTVSNKYSANTEKPIDHDIPEKVENLTTGAEIIVSDKPAKKNNEYVPAPRNKQVARQVTTGGYVPAPRNNTNLNSKAGAIVSQIGEYGIPKGTWIRGELKHHATSADSADVEFLVTENIEGKYKTLEAGTVFFASKSFNTSSRRLEALTNVAVTPDGDEISGISCYVYSSDQSPGLAGTVIRDREGEAVSVGKTSVLAAAANAIPGGAGMATEVVSNIGGELLNNEKNNVSEAPRAHIQVAPQMVWLKTDQKI